MTEKSKQKSKRKNGTEQRIKRAPRNAKGRFRKGNPGGPGRGHRRGPAMAKQPGTPRGDPAGSSIAWEDLLARAERAERELDRLRSELADERAVSVRQSREWSAALHVLEAHPAARGAVLDAVFGPGGGGEPPDTPDNSAAGSPGAKGTGVALAGRPPIPWTPGRRRRRLPQLGRPGGGRSMMG